VWNSRNGTLLAQLDGHTGAINKVALSPGGRLLATVAMHLCQILSEGEPVPECP
jgi:WD40 repeat protein